MKKRLKGKLSFLVSLILLAQLLLPAAEVLAADVNNNMLPPSNLSYQNVTPDDIKLTWSAVFGATGYKVYEIAEGQLIERGTSTTTSFAINNLPEGSYTYVVSTLSPEGESGPCAPITVTITYPDMTAPMLSYTIQNGNDIVLNWTASPYAESYSLYQIQPDGTQMPVKTLAARTYTVANAPAGAYSYAVSASNALYGQSPLSAPLAVNVVYPVMTAPANPSFTITNGSDVNLRWNAVQYATNYKVYQVTDGQKTLVSTVTTTSATLAKQPAGDYTYEIHSYSDRFGESADGSQVAVTISAVTMTAPANLTAKVQNVSDIVLTWSAVAYATGYKVYQVAADGSKQLRMTVAGTSATFTNQPGGDYVFEVHSYSASYGESADGSQTTITVSSVAMAPPANFTYAVQNGNDVLLKWDAASYTDYYKVYLVANGQKTLKTTTANTSIVFSNQPEGNYVYEVHSYSTRFGESADGAQVSFTLAFPEMQPPANVVQTISNATSFTLSWDAASYATGYKVYQIVNGQKVLKSTVAGLNVTYTGMSPGTYNYEVHSVSSRFGESADGTQVTVTLNGQTMQAPGNPAYTITNGNDITLKWSSVQYATSYKVYQVVDGQEVLKSTVTGTSVFYSNQPEGDYSFVIRSFSSLLGESPDGAQLSFTLTYPAMAAPGSFAYKIQNGNDIVLSWAAVTYANSYKVYELVDGQEVLKSTGASLTAVISRVPSGSHTYIVHSVSTRFGESPEGSQLTVDLNQPTMQAPAGFTQSIANGNDIALRWNAATYATAYNVYQIVDGQPVLKKTVTGTSVTLTNQPEGDYILEVHSYSDRFGESPEGSQLTLTLKWPVMQAPGGFAQSISNGNDVTLRWNGAAYATGYKLYQIVGGQRTLVKTLAAISTTLTNQPEGDYSYEVHSYSDRFGESPEGSQLTFTLKWPVMQAPSGFTQSVSNGNDITLRWNTATYSTAYKLYQIVGGQRTLVKTLAAASVTFTNQPEGDYSYEVHSYSDRFGESPAGSSLSFTLVWPVVQPPVLTSKVFNANNITLSWKAVTWANEYRVYDVSSGTRQLIYKGTALTYNVYNLSEDIHQYEMTAYSTRFGESAPSNRISENIVYPVMQPPVASVTLLSQTSARISWNFVTYANGYNVYEIIDGKPVLLVSNVNNLSYTVSDLSYRNHEYYVTSYSNSFGESEPSGVVLAKLIVDTEAPVTKSDAPDGWIGGPATVNLTATDNETGVAATYVSLNDGEFALGTSIAVEQDGVNKVSFYSVDNAGNKEAVQTVYVKIDRTAPVTAASGTADGWSAAAVNIALTASDAQSGVAHTYYSVNGADYVEGTSLQVDKEGINTVAFYSVDAAGNKEAVRTVQVKIDRTAPVTAAETPEGWVKEAVVSFKAADEQSGVAYTYYSINGAGFTEGTSVTVDQEGVNQIRYYSVDKAGNKEAVQTAEVKIDRTAPTTKSDAPEAWSSNDVTVSLVASDSESGVAKTFYSIDGSAYTEGSSFIVTIEGIHTVSYYSVDRAGNVEAVNEAVVKIDKTAPIVSLALNGEYKAGTTLPLTYSAVDGLSGIASGQMTVTLPDGSKQPVQNGGSISLTKPGTYTVTVTAVNGAGLSTTVTKQFTVYLGATISVTPTVIKGNKGVFTVRVELPDGYSTQGFDLNSVTVNGVRALNDNNGYYNQAKLGQFKFERSDFNWTTDEVTLYFRGYVNGILVIGQKTVKVQK